MKSTPFNQVKERFGDKSKLVAAVTQLATADLWLDRVNEVKGLARVSNVKLLKLHDTLAAVKKDFGSRAKLIAEILKLEKRQKDDGYKARLDGFSTPRLADLHQAANKRSRRAAAAAPKAAKPKAAAKKPARSKKAQAKAKAKAK
jgi:hypothetical protein